jgi:hypothetical protein
LPSRTGWIVSKSLLVSCGDCLVISGESGILPDPAKGNPELFEQWDYFEFFIAKEKKFFQEEGTPAGANVESYRLAKPAFTVTGIPTKDKIREYLILDSQILKLPQPVAPSSVFDFTIQREVNKELGIR